MDCPEQRGACSCFVFLSQESHQCPPALVYLFSSSFSKLPFMSGWALGVGLNTIRVNGGHLCRWKTAVTY